jgi:hypothetical protein
VGYKPVEHLQRFGQSAAGEVPGSRPAEFHSLMACEVLGLQSLHHK